MNRLIVRLLYVIPYYRPSLAFGGPVSACAKLAEAMAARGHAVQVLTTDAADREARIDVLREVIAGVEIRRLRNLSQRAVGANLFTPRSTRATLEELASKSDVIHVHEFFTWLSFRGATLSARRGKPVLLSGHGSLSLSEERGRIPVKRAWMRVLGTPTIRAARLVHTTTEYEAEQCVAAGVPRTKLRVIAQGVSPPPRRGDAQGFRALFGLSADRPLILFAGRLRASKGVDLLLEAASELAGHPLRPLFVLAGAAENRPDLAPQRLTENVLLTGVLSEQALQDAYAAASVVALPSFAEGMSMVVLDALAFGLPVLISHACNLPAVAERDAGVVVDTTSASVLAGLEHLLSRQEAWPAMGARGQNLVLERYASERIYDAYEGVYQELMRA